MFLMIDNYDSFVYNLVRYFQELKEEIIVYRNDKITIEEIEKINPDGIIISPGPKDPSDAGICLQVIHRFKGKIPIFGICLGHQAIAQYFGGHIVQGDKPLHGKVTPIIHTGSGIFAMLPNPIKVTRYHSLIVDRFTLPHCFHITSETDDGVIMGIRHKQYLIEGVQFHPEAELTEYGHKMIKNFIIECKIYKSS